MPLSLSDANQVIEKAHARAAQIGVKVTVAIVDEGGLLIALGRMDGATPLSPQLAEAKAVGAAMMLRDGAALAQMAQDRPGFFSAVDRLVRVPLIPGLGSLPLKRDGKIVGAIGVSGARPEQDLDCAEAGLSEG
jgi:glc operon protein GlcG